LPPDLAGTGWGYLESKKNMRAKLRFVVCLAVLALIPCPPAAAQDALQLLHKMQQALGGADKIAGIQDFEQNVRAETDKAEYSAAGSGRCR
jgi:hypothetical protein